MKYVCQSNPKKEAWYLGLAKIAGLAAVALLCAVLRGTLYTLVNEQQHLAQLLIDLLCIALLCAVVWLVMFRSLTSYTYQYENGVLTLSAVRGRRVVKQKSINKADVLLIGGPAQGERWCCRGGNQSSLTVNINGQQCVLVFAPDEALLNALKTE